jgi:hypothetical protein
LIPIPTSLIEILTPLLFLAFLILFFLPSILELKRPKDAGPRKIPNITLNKLTVNKANLSFLLILEDIEEKKTAGKPFETMTPPTRNPISILANIEA